jgi:hypothetical protein
VSSAVAQEVWAHPVSFLTDPDRRAADLAGLGVTAVRLAHTYHSGRWLLRSGTPGRTVDLPPGSWTRHAPGAPWPVVHPTAFDDAAEALRRAGMQVLGWVVGLHTDTDTRPRWLLRNAFGDALRHALCPAQADVVTAAAGLVGAAAAAGVDGLDLEAFGFLGWAHDGGHRKGTAGPAAQWLLSLCFCPACAAGLGAAGADPVAARMRVQRAVATLLAGPEPVDALPAVLPAMLGDDLHGALLTSRAAAVRRLLTAVRAAAGDLPLWLRATADPYSVGGRTGGDLAELHALVGGLLLSDLSGGAGPVTDLAAVAGLPGAAVAVGLRPDAASTAAPHPYRKVWYAYDLAAPAELARAVQGNSGRPDPGYQS